VRYVTPRNSLWINIGFIIGLGVPLIIIIIIIIIVIVVERVCRRRRNKADVERNANSDVTGSIELREDTVSTLASESGYSENDYSGPRSNQNRHYSAIGLPVPATNNMPTLPQYLSVM